MKHPPSQTALSAAPPDVLSLLNFCKGLAIAWIVLFHYRGEWFGWQGVHIFIVLSSFGLTYSCVTKGVRIAWKQWYLRRIERILPSYWLVCFLVFLIVFVSQLFSHNNGFIEISKSIFNLFLDLSLLKNFFSSNIILQPNPALWFVPFIISFYLIAPWLYHQVFRNGRAKNYLAILLGAAAVEFIYRAISIYFLDGSPMGYEKQAFLGIFSIQPDLPLPLDKIPNKFIYFFQFRAPFGFVFARVAEFVLGMIGAMLFVKNHSIFNKLLFSIWTIIAGLTVWILGNTLMFAGLWGWVFADFLIAGGLILWVINLAAFCQQKLPSLFNNLSQLGEWSYYIFLTHSIFIYVPQQIVIQLKTNASPALIPLLDISVFVLMIIGTAVSSWLVMRFDQSRYSKLMIKKVFASLISR